jgi:hypothetical protein
MRRAALSWCLVTVLAVLVAFDARAQNRSPRLWFCPGPGTLDYIRLFDHPEEWPRARRLVSVFKFYQQHTLMPADSIVGPDSYDALARAGAFRMLRQWGIETAIEVASVKEFYCTPDARGMNESIAATLASVRAVEAAGGAVSYLAMDEPFVSGRARGCGGPALEPTADRVAAYVSAVGGSHKNQRTAYADGAAALAVRYHSTVRRSPSSNDTIGSYFRISRAFVMSACESRTSPARSGS